MKYPLKLTNEEWNFLNELITYNKMDSWCMFKEFEDRDMAYDYDNDKFISIREALIDIYDCLNYDDVVRLGGEDIWKGLCEKFNINPID
jgi:hypothetical protein